MTWEEGLVGGQELNGRSRFDEIFGNRTLEFITLAVGETVTLGGFHVKVRTFEFVVLFGDDYFIWSPSFLFEILFVNGSFCQIRFDIIQLTQVPTTIAFVTKTCFRAMLSEI